MTTIRDGQPQGSPPESPSEDDENPSELRRTALLAEIGLNFAEMIHDLRQPLTGILGFAQLIGEHPNSSKIAAWSAEIVRESRRMQEMMERMRLFARVSSAPANASFPAPSPSADPCLAAEAAIRLLPRLPPGIQLTADLPKGGAGTVAMAPDDLERLLWNLLLNARDAILAKAPQDQDCAFSDLSLPSGLMLLRVSREAEGAAVVVADQGAGIPEALRDTLFRPFVTSKGDRGTGLGLFICRKLAREAGGSLETVTPPPGFTTAFRLFLPKSGA